MSNLYSFSGGQPAPLPFRITLSDGSTRTNQGTFTPEEIADAGYQAVPPRPVHDPATQRVKWDGSSWAVEDLPAPAIVYQPLNKLETMALFRSVVGMDDAGELAMRHDPALELHWFKWSTDVPQVIHRDNPLVVAFLDALIATGYATGAQKAATLAAWPQEGAA